jgi:hopanoid C-3 methylase
MKVLLIQAARWASPLSAAMVIEPLGLEVVGAHIREQHDVELLDMRWDPDLKSVLERFNPDVVGATVITAEVNPSTEVFRQVKEHNPKVVTIAGGPQAILAPDVFQDRYLDIAVMTEGELVFPELINALEDGKDLRSIPGLALFNYRGERGIIRTERRPLIADLSKLKLPDRTLTAPYRSRYFRGEWKPLGASYTTRGCHYRCTFCCVWILGGAVYRTRGIDTCLRDLSSLQEEYVFMAEDDSMFDTGYSDALADAIISSGIRKKYQFYSRTDLVVSKPELFEKWRKAGLELLLLGMEMASDEELDSINKQNTTHNNEIAVKILRSLGTEPIAYFMVDPATFTADHFKRLTDYIIRLELSHPIFFIMTPLPGTTQYRQRSEIVRTDNLDLFDFYHCTVETKLPLGEFYQRFINLYRDCYQARSHDVANSSAFSADVVDRLVTRLEEEYAPYIHGSAPQTLSMDTRGAPLFPLKFRPGWIRPRPEDRDGIEGWEESPLVSIRVHR